MSQPSSVSGTGKAFKEKYVSVLEDMFAGRSSLRAAREKGIQGQSTIQKFWDELLLLKVNQGFLAQCISSRTEEELREDAKPVLNELFAACVKYLSDRNLIRVAHALETLTILLGEINRKRFSQQGLTITTLVAGSVDNADLFFRRLITAVGTVLTREDVPVLLKSLCLRLYLTMLTATDNVNSNPVASYFFSNDIMDSLIGVLSVKLTSDRKLLVVDAVLVLLLLLLWRESENLYILKLSAPSAPLQSLLSTVGSLLSSTSSATVKTSVADPAQGWDDMINYVSSFFGFGTPEQTTADAGEEDCGLHWCNRTCGLVLLYFLVYMNPAFASNQVWPAVSDYVEGTVTSQSLTSQWTSAFKSFISLCQDEFLRVSAASDSRRISEAKVSLAVLRCMGENSTALDYLCYCDAADFSLKGTRSANGLVSSGYVVPFKSVACAVVEMAANILAGPLVDADLFYRAGVVVAVMLKNFKSQAWQLSSSSLNTAPLWKALVHCCVQCRKESSFQRPGVPELAELVTGILEWCLATSQDIFASAEDSEALHAAVMCEAVELQQLTELVAASASSVGTLQAKSLLNIVAVKHHYELQIAAAGVRGKPSFEQALAIVRKKGTAGLKLKVKYVGPGRLYIEGITELRVLNTLVRSVVNARKKLRNAVPKLENEAF